MAAPTPISNQNTDSFYQQLTTVVAIDTWYDLIVKDFLPKNTVFKMSMQNLDVDDLRFGIRLFDDNADPDAESLLAYEAVLPGIGGGEEVTGDRNAVKFSIPMNDWLGPGAQGEDYINGLSSRYEFNSDNILNFDGRRSLQIYVGRTSNFIATATISYAAHTAEEMIERK